MTGTVIGLLLLSLIVIRPGREHSHDGMTALFLLGIAVALTVQLKGGIA